MENNMKTCPRDCMKCHPNQWLYCAAQTSRTILERQDEVLERLEKMEDKVKKLEQAADKSVFNPMEAQEADGAENRPAETTNQQNNDTNV